MDAIRARGVRVHNLKNIDVDIPRGKIVAICGKSGSGKTSLALDTLYAEGQRRYIESFSAYTRQFLERIEKPEYDSIEGLPPALAVSRSGTQRGNRSTVGTASETLDFLRVLFANVATLHCHQCGREIQSHSPASVAEWIAGLPRQKLMLGFPVEWQDVGERSAILADLQADGFVRVIVSGRVHNLGEADRQDLRLGIEGCNRLSVIVDRLQGGDLPDRTLESLEVAFQQGHGQIEFYLHGNVPEDSPWPASDFSIDGRDWQRVAIYQHRKCPACEVEYPEPEARLFNFNSPLGACALCEGFGDTIDLDWNLVVPDRTKSLEGGAIAPWNSPAYAHNLQELLSVAPEMGVPVDVAYSRLKKSQRRKVEQGDTKSGYEGVAGFFRWLERKKYKMHVRVFLSRYRSYNRCSECGGQRLNKAALSYRLGNQNFAQLCDLAIDGLHDVITSLQLSQRSSEIAKTPREQVLNRLSYLQSVGLGYLQLARPIRTLSGGEAQRTALTAALGSDLVDMLYVLDEPSVGLHPDDIERLVTAIRGLACRGNTVILVEHEDALLRKSDTIIEIGPHAGARGGNVVYIGDTREALAQEAKSGDCETLDYLRGMKSIPGANRYRESTKHIHIGGCSGNNLKSVDVDIPLGVLVAVTGVSGSGKSSLIQDTLYPAIAARLGNKSPTPLPFKKITGVGQISDCIFVDQTPVSRSPRSNPVTFVKAFDEIRKAFAETQDAKLRGFSPGHFSFNSDLGRCSECSGDGVLQVDMQFLADVRMTCPSCEGKRYRNEILSARYRDRSIADVLEMTCEEAIPFFRGHPKVQTTLQVLTDVGLGYLPLGQSSTTLSSGEAQRLKLAGFLSAASKKRTLFLLDEPTTGLHFEDIATLLRCFSVLIENGHSVLVVEHNMHLVAGCDHVIDLGPGAAEAGGELVVAGTPRQVAQCKSSLTGKHLRATFGR